MSSGPMQVPEVNAHIHTPYSFSAFTGIGQIFEMALQEGIQVVGINDFNVTDGYPEFYDHARSNRIYPLFNIEFIALDRDMQKQGIRINDPNNPGRIYLSGKGLDFPAHLEDKSRKVVDSVIREGHRQIRTMIEKTNRLLAEAGTGIFLDFTAIRKRHALEIVRERHLAKALRTVILEKYPAPEDQKGILARLYDGRFPTADPANEAATEIEIRNILLKAGGRAFVEEDEKAFPTIAQVQGIIAGSGGIACYPVLLDDVEGNLTDFESDWHKLYEELTARGIFCIELIPRRNDYQVLKNFVHFFRDQDFIILFGTEHNTPELAPLKVNCRHGVELDPDLKQISYQGACILAAHQHLRAKRMSSPVPSWNTLDLNGKKEIISTGKAVINRFINS